MLFRSQGVGRLQQAAGTEHDAGGRGSAALQEITSSCHGVSSVALIVDVARPGLEAIRSTDCATGRVLGVSSPGMAGAPKNRQSAQDLKDDRAERLAAALRENLKRRKAQARAQKDDRQHREPGTAKQDAQDKAPSR